MTGETPNSVRTECAGDVAFSGSSDIELLLEVEWLAARERRCTTMLVAALAEVDRRQLYRALGYSSLYSYCRKALRMSEHAAYGRIEAARAVSKYPQMLELLAAGELTLTTISILAPVLTPENKDAVLALARGRSKRDVLQIVAAIHPMPTLAAILQQTPLPDEGATVLPVSPENYRLQVTINKVTYDRLTRLQDLMRHANPSGDIAVILERALGLLAASLEPKQRDAAAVETTASAEAPVSRHIPKAVQDAVRLRDGDRCAFVGTHGRCEARTLLQLHHLTPFARGGPHRVENLELRCAAHNRYEAELVFSGEQRRGP